MSGLFQPWDPVKPWPDEPDHVPRATWTSCYSSGCGIEDLFARERFAEHSRETVDWRARPGRARSPPSYFAPHNRKADLNEPTYDGRTVHLIPEVRQALRAFVDAGFLSAPLDEADGGDQLPFTVYCACMSWFHAANAGTTGYAAAHHGRRQPDPRSREPRADRAASPCR